MSRSHVPGAINTLNYRFINKRRRPEVNFLPPRWKGRPHSPRTDSFRLSFSTVRRNVVAALGHVTPLSTRQIGRRKSSPVSRTGMCVRPMHDLRSIPTSAGRPKHKTVVDGCGVDTAKRKSRGRIVLEISDTGNRNQTRNCGLLYYANSEGNETDF